MYPSSSGSETIKIGQYQWTIDTGNTRHTRRRQTNQIKKQQTSNQTIINTTQKIKKMSNTDLTNNRG